MAREKTTLRSFSLLTVITVIEKIIAFLFEAIIASTLGTNIITDGYFTSKELFTLIDGAFLSAIVVVALNRFTLHVNSENEERGFEVLSDLQSVYLPLMLILTSFIFICAKPLSFIVAPGYTEEARLVVIRCIKIMSVIPSIVCLICIGLAVLRQKKEFGITALKSLFISVVGIISVLVFGGENIKNADVLSVAYVISMFLYCLLVRLSTRRYGHLNLHFPRMTDDVKSALKMMLPLMVSYGIARVALMVDKIIASTLGVGAVSALTYAHSLYTVVGAIFVANLTTIMLTDFNNIFARKEYGKICATMKRTISIMTLVLIPITLVSVFCANDIVKIVYERGRFSPQATVLVGGVLLFYALNFVPIMIQGIQNQCLYAFGDTLSPMVISLIAIIVNLGTSIPLALMIGLPGVAIGTCISTVLAVVLQTIAVKKKLPEYGLFYKTTFIVKCLFSGGIAALGIWLVTRFVNSSLLTFVLSTVVAFGMFFGVMILMKEENTDAAIQIVKQRLHKAAK